MENKILEILLEMQESQKGMEESQKKIQKDIMELKSGLKRIEEKSDNGFAIMGKHFMEVKETLQQHQQKLESIENNRLDVKVELLNKRVFDIESKAYGHNEGDRPLL